MWYVRWDVPIDVRHAFENKRILKQRLSSDKKEAERLRDGLIYQWKTKTAQVRNGSYDPERRVKEALIEITSYDQRNKEQYLIEIHKDFDNISRQFSEKETATKLLNEWQDTYRNHEANIFSAYRENLLGSIQEIISFIANRVGKLISRGEANDFVDLTEKYTRELQIAFISDAIDSNLTYSEIRNLADTTALSLPVESKHGLSDSAINAWKTSLADQHKTTKTISDYVAKVKRFQKYLNDNDLEFNFISVRDFKNSISPMKQTQSSYVGAIRKLWKWSIANQPAFARIHKGSPPPTDGHQYPKHGENKGESYIAFKDHEVKLLFDSCLEKKKPDLELACLIAYGVYTGARIEEIGAINNKNTEFYNNNPIAFNIEDSKTISGIRQVPIHHRLGSLHKELLKKKGTDLSIYSIKETKRGTKIDHLSKRFSRLKTSLNFSKRHVFHSLRKTFITALYNQKTFEPLIQRIVGHKGENVTADVYLDDFTFNSKSEAVDGLEFSIDISKLESMLKEQ